PSRPPLFPYTTLFRSDEDKLIGYSRLGDRLRISSTAEFAGFDRSHKPAHFAAMLRTARELFPGAFDENKAELWAGLRPMMPSSVDRKSTRLNSSHVKI